MNENQSKSAVSSSEIIFQWNTDAPVTLHIFAISFFVITGIIGNTLIIYIKAKRKILNETDIYIFVLACIDLTSSINCIQMAFINTYVEQYKNNEYLGLRQLFASWSFTMWTYNSLLVAIALNRVYAVFRPYSYRSSTKRAKITVVFIFGICLIVTSNDFIQYLPVGVVNRILIVVILGLFLALISTSYLAIAVKLQLLKRKNTKYESTTKENIDK